MPRLNDLTDLTLTGIRGGNLGNWKPSGFLDLSGSRVDKIECFRIISSNIKNTNQTKTFIYGMDSSARLSIYELAIDSIDNVKSGLSYTTIVESNETSGVSQYGRVQNGCLWYNESTGTFKLMFAYRSDAGASIAYYNHSSGSLARITLTDGWVPAGFFGNPFDYPASAQKTDNGLTLVNDDASTWVIVAQQNGGTNTILYTADNGVTFTSTGVTLNGSGSNSNYHISGQYVNGYFYIMTSGSTAQSGTIYKSADGINWTTAHTFTSTDLTMNVLPTDLRFVSGMWMANDALGGGYIIISNGDITKWHSWYSTSDLPAITGRGFTQVGDYKDVRITPTGKVITNQDAIGGRVSNKDKVGASYISNYGLMFFTSQPNSSNDVRNIWYLLDLSKYNESAKTIPVLANTELGRPTTRAFAPYGSLWKTKSRLPSTGTLGISSMSVLQFYKQKYNGKLIAVTGTYNQYDTSRPTNKYIINRISTSTDGLNWTVEDTGLLKTSLATGQTEWQTIIAGNETDDSVLYLSCDNSIFISSSGNLASGNWSSAATIASGFRAGFSYTLWPGYSYPLSSTTVPCVGRGNDWLIIGQRTDTNKFVVLKSTDGGANFSDSGMTFTNGDGTYDYNVPPRISYINGYWVVTNNTKYYYSTDFSTWTQVTPVDATDSTTFNIYSTIEYANGYYFIYSTNRTWSFYSTDITSSSWNRVVTSTTIGSVSLTMGEIVVDNNLFCGITSNASTGEQFVFLADNPTGGTMNWFQHTDGENIVQSVHDAYNITTDYTGQTYFTRPVYVPENSTWVISKRMADSSGMKTIMIQSTAHSTLRNGV